ncbi:hypothetical protein [uncultured Roseovarius sp.]|uniref:hypothetical protein n=1 Tax=uncultured Roseovarius sp. TaxID=293344 RepID=UPI00260B3028|nr:hypothetical protein [uncultured Roseovarius sp.]
MRSRPPAMAEGQHRLADALTRAGLDLGSQSTRSASTGRDPGQSGQPAPAPLPGQNHSPITARLPIPHRRAPPRAPPHPSI